MASRWKVNDRETPKIKRRWKTKISWCNKRRHLGEIQNIVAVQKIFTPILKAKSSSTKIKMPCSILISCAGYKNKKLCSILIRGAESKTWKSKKQSREETKSCVEIRAKKSW
jgi:hypothetical protein